MYYYVKADLTLITPGATTITVYDGTSKKAAELASLRVSDWLMALNQHGAWLAVIEERNHNGASSSVMNRTWRVSWTGPLNAFGIREEFLLAYGSQDYSGSKMAEFPPGRLVLDAIRGTLPTAWFEGILSNDVHWLRHQHTAA